MRRLVVGVLTLTAVFLTIGVAQAAAQTGSIEICKASTNGMAAYSFTFHVVGPAPSTADHAVTPASIRGGQCTDALSGLAPGDYTVSEDPTVSPPTDVTKITATAGGSGSVGGVFVLKSKNYAARSAVVHVFDGLETLVTFTNSLPQSQLKICKTSNLWANGTLFSFSLNGGAAFSVGVGSCSKVYSFTQDNTIVNARELPVLNNTIDDITIDGPADQLGSDPGSGLASVRLHPGLTIITYDNEPTGPPQTGEIKICKYGTGDFPVTGTFTFTIDDGSPTPQQAGPLGIGECTFPITVNAGVVTVTEDPNPGTALDHATVDPASAQIGDTNLTNQSVQLDVPVGGDATEVIASFYNKVVPGHVEVCKRLATNSGSGALATTLFKFDLFSADPNDPANMGILPFATISVRPGTCVLVTRPTGSTVYAVEQPLDNVSLVNITVSGPGSTDLADSTGAAVVPATGSNTITFTNEAMGTIEICKVGLDAATLKNSFTFTVTGEGGFSVRKTVKAGTDAFPGCTPAFQVPAGVVGIKEAALAGFEIDHVTVDPTSRWINTPTTSPVNVLVPFGALPADTTVTFYNRVSTGTVKWCKKLMPDSGVLRNSTFTFDYQTFNEPGNTPILPAGTGVPLKPGECTKVTGIPVISSDGHTPTQFNVKENPSTGTVAIFDDNGGALGTVPFYLHHITTIPLSAQVGLSVPAEQVAIRPVANGTVEADFYNAVGTRP